MVLDHFHNERFVFNSDFSFVDRYDGEANYFEPSDERYLTTNNRQWIWETNFIPDARKAQIDAQEQKGAGVNLTQFEISDNTLIGHLAEWPVGRYHKARSEEHTSELQSRGHLVCRLLLEKKNKKHK